MMSVQTPIGSVAEKRVPSIEVVSIELDIIRLLAQGLQSKEIAALVGKKKPTVEGYIRTLYIKLGAKSRAQLVAIAYKRGIIQ